jgi:MFS family permease
MDKAVGKRSVLLVAAAASFMTPFMGASVNIALPVIGIEFGADAVTLSWVSTAYMLAAAAFLVPFGRIADIVGRNRVFLGFGFGLFSSPNANAIMSSVERRRYGLASGMVGTMRLTGQMFSMEATMLVSAL